MYLWKELSIPCLLFTVHIYNSHLLLELALPVSHNCTTLQLKKQAVWNVVTPEEKIGEAMSLF